MAIHSDSKDSQHVNGMSNGNHDAYDPIAERDGWYVPKQDEQGYQILERPMGTKRKIKVILMGAGASSLNFFRKAEEQLEQVEWVCYEKNHEIGGTWLENRYPGAACDIPSVNYQFSWKIKLWTHYYSFSPEIFEYLKDIEREGDYINKYIKLKHQIERAEWDNEAGLWRVKVKNLETGEVFDDSAEFFINAGGVLNTWKWPDTPGLHDFQGKLMHSAAYEEGLDLTGKKVAVIGAGSSGVQIVSAIQEKVEKLYHWIRSPIWITAAFGHAWAGKDGSNFAYSKEQLEYLEKNPKKYLEYRKAIENELNQRFKFIIKGSQEAETARNFANDQMMRKLKSHPHIAEKIIPANFNPGCRRPTPAPGYLEALTADNTIVFTDNIQKVDATGFFDSKGEHHDVDIIITAAGFDTTWLPKFPFIAHGKDLRDVWGGKDNVTSYLSVGVPEFPNHFSYCGPYGPLGHGSFMPLIEQWTQYIFHVIDKVQTEEIKSLQPKWRVAAQFRQHADLFLKRTAWTSPCRSWFKQGKEDGQAAIYPGSRLHFMQLLKSPRYEDFDIEYWHDNMFAFLGDGFEKREFDGRDITNYLGLLREDGKDVQPDFDQTLVDKLAGWKMQEEEERKLEGETNGAATRNVSGQLKT